MLRRPGRRGAGGRAAADRGDRAEGHGEQGVVPRAVQQPQEPQGPDGGGDGVHRAAGRRRQLPDRVRGAVAAGTGAGHRQGRVHHGVRRAHRGRQLCRAGAGRPGGPETAAGGLRGRAGRRHVHVRPVLLLPGDGRRRRAHLAGVRVPDRVRHRVLRRRRLRPGRVPGRDVHGERALALFRHRVHRARVQLVRLQQDVPVRVRPVRHIHRVLDVRVRQRDGRVRGAPVRHRDHRQNVPGDPGPAGG